MNDPPGMGIVKGLGNLQSDIYHIPDGRWFFFNHLIQRATLQELHGDIDRILVLAHIIHRNNIGMTETTDGLGFF